MNREKWTVGLKELKHFWMILRAPKWQSQGQWGPLSGIKVNRVSNIPDLTLPLSLYNWLKLTSETSSSLGEPSGVKLWDIFLGAVAITDFSSDFSLDWETDGFFVCFTMSFTFFLSCFCVLIVLSYIRHLHYNRFQYVFHELQIFHVIWFMPLLPPWPPLQKVPCGCPDVLVCAWSIRNRYR